MSLREQIEQHKTGWLSPKLEFFPVEIYTHIKSALELPVGEKLDKIFSELSHRVSEAERGCRELAEEGEHPEWHVYEMALDNANATIRNEMLKAGWMRVFIMSDKIYFEGTQNSLLDKAKTIQAKLDGTDYQIKWNVQKFD